MPENKKPLYVILHNIRSAHNVGSIFRTAEGLGVSRIYCCGYTAYPLPKNKRHPNLGQRKLAKTALGAETMVPWEHHWQTWRVLKRLKQNGVRLAAMERTAGSRNLATYEPEFPLGVLLGNEIKGLSPAILAYCDDILEIPMAGRKTSFNVAVTAGMALYAITSSPNTPVY